MISSPLSAAGAALGVAALGIATMVSGEAYAQQRRAMTPAVQAEPAWYIGLGAGTSSIKEPSSDFLNVGGATSVGATHDTSHTMMRALGGFRLSRNWSVEAGYGDYGTFGGQRTYSTGTIGAKVRVSGFNFHLVGWLPIANSVAGFAKVGYVATTVKTEASTTMPGITTPNLSRKEVNLSYGLGLQYDFSRSWAVRAEWEQIKNVGNKNDYGLETNVSTTSATALYKF